ncbi:Mitochondrial distribution and morphology protein 12 [Cryptotrichosporon argae]
MWRMSWGAYLEHCFYPPVTKAGFQCPHDAHNDQIRYFAHRNLAIRIHNEAIDIYEPLPPPIVLQVKPETKVVLKNREYESVLTKIAAFFDSVLLRLRSFNFEVISTEKVALLRQAVEALLSKAVADRDELNTLLNRTYKLTHITDVLALNTVLRVLQDKVVQWDSDFVDVEKAFMPSETDLRKMTASHLKRLFANQDVFGSLERSIAGLTVSEVDEKDVKSTNPASDGFAASDGLPAAQAANAGPIGQRVSCTGSTNLDTRLSAARIKRARPVGVTKATVQVFDNMSSGGGERSSIMKTLTGLWAFRAGDYSPLEYPLSASEHIFADSRVIIRENEPTSVIAFTLSSKAYRDNIRTALQSKSSIRGQETFMPGEAGHERGSSTWDIVSLDEAMDVDDVGQGVDGGTHLKYDFESGSSTIFCRIFFAEQFAALRTACQCEDNFVESLARCGQFDASGGKSGSAFLKTKDDRFIAKEVSRLEMDALTKFAPAYFEYTHKTFQGLRPSVLAKIYGFFKIGYRNAVTGRTMKMNVLIMENLFYERKFAKIFDLKGSMRNRLIQPTGRINEVLLDENLMEIVYKHPLYLHEPSKRVLRTALFNDTLFLSSLNVMDYSLVVGVDVEHRELVVGIVDYIRTFTWDKKLESWVKDSGFLGGAGKGEPTIVTPKQYKTRFRAAMDRFYFPSVPDRWSTLGTEDMSIEDE